MVQCKKIGVKCAFWLAPSSWHIFKVLFVKYTDLLLQLPLRGAPDLERLPQPRDLLALTLQLVRDHLVLGSKKIRMSFNWRFLLLFHEFLRVIRYIEVIFLESWFYEIFWRKFIFPLCKNWVKNNTKSRRKKILMKKLNGTFLQSFGHIKCSFRAVFMSTRLQFINVRNFFLTTASDAVWYVNIFFYFLNSLYFTSTLPASPAPWPLGAAP